MSYWYPELHTDERKVEVARILALVSAGFGEVIDWSEALWRDNGTRIDRESQMLVMREVADRLDDCNLAAMLRNWWRDCDGAWRIGTVDVVAWFRRAGPIDDGQFPWPAAPFLAWRGTMDDSAAAQRGLSWTLERTKAFWFATKDPVDHRDRPGFLWETEVTPDAVLATFNHNGEREVIVDPGQIGNIRLVRSVPLGRHSALEQQWREDFVRERAVRLGGRMLPVTMDDRHRDDGVTIPPTSCLPLPKAIGDGRDGRDDVLPVLF